MAMQMATKKNVILKLESVYYIFFTHILTNTLPSGKFATHSRDLRCVVLMFPMYLLLNFCNLGRSISKLCSLGHLKAGRCLQDFVHLQGVVIPRARFPFNGLTGQP
jgi:hypothetical protein